MSYLRTSIEIFVGKKTVFFLFDSRHSKKLPENANIYIFFALLSCGNVNDLNE